MKLIRSFIFEEKSKSDVMAMVMVPGSCKGIEDMFVCLGIKQIFERTDIKFYIEIESKPSKILSSIAHQIAFEFAKSICNFKTYIKQEYLLKTSSFDVKPFSLEDNL